MNAIIFNKNSILLPVTRQKLDKLRETFKRDKLTRWSWFNSRGIEVTAFDGNTISISGGDYNDQTASVFFSFVVPFLQDEIVKTLDETLETCRDRGLKPEEPYIRETAMLLDGYLIDPIYRYMADIDRRIRGRGRGYPKNVGRKDVTDEITEMVKFLDKCKDEMIQGIKERNTGNAAQEKSAVIKQPSYSRSQSIQELIAKGENHTLEFKETFQYNLTIKEIDKGVRHDALKTIAGFLNADGGTLLIGISDSGEVKGIAIDKKAMERADNDKFELYIRNYIAGQNSKFMPSAIGYVKFKFEKLEGYTICIIDVQPLPKSEILHFDDVVYVRDGNKTLKLTGTDLTGWIKQRELEGKTTPNTPKADESTQDGVITQDIEELLELFRQLENLLNPALPTKDDSLWREAKKEAQKELSDQLREHSLKFSERPGLYVPPKKATNAEQRKAKEQIENRITLIAEKKYSEKDQAYLEVVDAAKKTTADVLKRIDHLLECFGGALQRFRRTKDTWLVVDFKKIRKLYDGMDKEQIKYSLRETIDTLEALKLKLERH